MGFEARSGARRQAKGETAVRWIAAGTILAALIAGCATAKRQAPSGYVLVPLSGAGAGVRLDSAFLQVPTGWEAYTPRDTAGDPALILFPASVQDSSLARLSIVQPAAYGIGANLQAGVPAARLLATPVALLRERVAARPGFQELGTDEFPWVGGPAVVYRYAASEGAGKDVLQWRLYVMLGRARLYLLDCGTALDRLGEHTAQFDTIAGGLNPDEPLFLVAEEPAPTIAPEETPPDPYARYRVRAADTLELIAKRLTGDPKKVAALAGANQITDPNKLVVGQILLIPVELLSDSGRTLVEPGELPQDGD
ncbi:MAG: LysM peptidoglycan-binding domain-containing protein [Candidatus Schekmanbacteria bacterium]|nr:LysM peptidoglycan-binding domain-containing protein [Candidatus Schekmanbacteria bacterium]